MSQAPAKPDLRTDLRTVRVHLENGTSYITQVNAAVPEHEVKAYFVGQPFNFGDTPTHPKDLILHCTHVEFPTA